MTKFNWNDTKQVQRMAQLRALNITYKNIAQIITDETGITMTKDDIRLGLQRHINDAFNIKGGK